MYHPHIYKTSLCTNFSESKSTESRGKTCLWGNLCTHGHGKDDLRVRTDPSKPYVARNIDNTQSRTEGSFSTSAAADGSNADWPSLASNEINTISGADITLPDVSTMSTYRGSQNIVVRRQRSPVIKLEQEIQPQTRRQVSQPVLGSFDTTEFKPIDDFDNAGQAALVSHPSNKPLSFSDALKGHQLKQQYKGQDNLKLPLIESLNIGVASNSLFSSPLEDDAHDPMTNTSKTS